MINTMVNNVTIKLQDQHKLFEQKMVAIVTQHMLMQLPKSFLFQTSRRQSLLQYHRQHAGYSTATEVDTIGFRAGR